MSQKLASLSVVLFSLGSFESGVMYESLGCS